MGNKWKCMCCGVRATPEILRVLGHFKEINGREYNECPLLKKGT